MTDTDVEEGSPRTVDRTVEWNERRGRGRGGRMVAGAVFAVVFVVLAGVLFAPNEVAGLFGWDTSESEEMQSTSKTGDGISTAMTMPRQLDTQASEIDTEIMVPPPVEPEAGPVAPAPAPVDDGRIAELEASLQDFMDAQNDGATAVSEMIEAQSVLFEQERAAVAEAHERQLELQEERHQDELAQMQQAYLTQQGNGDDVAAREAAQRAAEEAEEREAIRQAQISSEGIVIDSGTAGAGASGGSVDRKLTGNETFLAAAATQTHETVRASMIPSPARTIVQGTLLEATLETALTTDLPGALRAVLSRDVYSFDGQNVLLPRGTRLIGTYSTKVALAQGRVLVAWTRAVTPSGKSVALGGIGADPLGRSGQSGFVDNHFFTRFGSAALISVIGMLPTLLTDEDSSESQQDLAEETSAGVRSATDEVIAEYLKIPPTIYVDQGVAMSIFVNRDLVL